MSMAFPANQGQPPHPNLLKHEFMEIDHEQSDTNEQSLLQSPGMREVGSNRQHMIQHLCDHSYAAAPRPDPEQPGFSEPSTAVPFYSHQVFHQPPASPDISTEMEDPVHRRVYSQISRDYVIYGTTGALKSLLDYIDGLNSLGGSSPEDGGIADLQCKEGVILSKALSIGHPGVYREGRHYSTICRLGTGSFGSVFRCKDLSTGTEFALKKVYMRSFRRQEVEVLIELMDKTSGARCLPQIYGILLDDDFVCIMMEFVDSCWHEYVRNHKQHERKIPEDTIVELLKQSLHGLRHLQLHKVSHCDIKPENMGYNCRGEVKFLDFGTVRLNTEELSYRGMTPHYMPPEVCQRVSHFNSDMWSLGCTVLYLVIQSHPWFNLDKTTNELIRRISTYPQQIFDYISFAQSKYGLSQPLASLLTQMLHADPNHRIIAEDALKHSVFRMSRPMSGTLGSLGIKGEEVPTVVTKQASNSKSTEQPTGLQGTSRQPQETSLHPSHQQGTTGHQPVLRKVTQANMAQRVGAPGNGHPSTAAMLCYAAEFRRGPPGNGMYQGGVEGLNEAGDMADHRAGPSEHDSTDMSNELQSRGLPNNGNLEGMVDFAGKVEKPCNQTSGYCTDTSDEIGIEVCYKDRVEEFRIMPQLTIGEIWPQLRETAQRLTGGIGAVAIYEGPRKLDTSLFNETIHTPRKFSLHILRE